MTLKPDQTVLLLGTITTDSVTKALHEIISFYSKKNTEEITLIVSSGGGSIQAGFTMIDIIQSMRIPLTTIATGHVGSMAIPVFCLGNRRLVTRHTSFFFHEVGFRDEKPERKTLSQIQDHSDDLENSQRWYAEFISEQSSIHIHPQRIIDLMIKESWLYPTEIKALGIAHEII